MVSRTFPLWPRPDATEVLEWLTDVLVSENGSEPDRTEMRDAPTQEFSYRYFVPPHMVRTVNNLIYGARSQQWNIPVWAQVQNVGAIAALQTTITCETRYSEFRDAGFVMLWQSPTQFQILQMDTVASDTVLNLVDPTEAFTNAWLMPVRIGFITRPPKRDFDGRNSIIDLTFEAEDMDELTVADPAQYLGADVYLDPGLLSGGSLLEQLEARFDVFDESLGLVSYNAPWDNIKPARLHRMLAADAAEAWAIREFLHRRRGRSVGFWQPSFEADLKVMDSGSITGSISVERDNYDLYAAARSNLAFDTDSGWLLRAVTNRTDLGGGELQLTLSSSLGGIDASTIRRICYLGFKRLSGDRVEFSHLGGTAVECSVGTLEITP